jgi:uncharacterized protein (TIGR04255 family)
MEGEIAPVVGRQPSLCPRGCRRLDKPLFPEAPSCAIWSLGRTMSRDHLPNAPLVQVSCEIRFHGELALYDAWGRFQHDVRAEFPKLFVPPAVAGLPPLTQHVKLASADGAESILLAINSFAFSAERYQDFPAFRDRFLALQTAFCQRAELGELTRFGLRYVNILPPVADYGALGSRVHHCLKIELTGLGAPDAPWVNQPHIVAETKAGRLALRTALLSAVPMASPGEAEQSVIPGLLSGVQLDLDCYLHRPGGVQALPVLLEEAHAVIDAAFFGMITNEYHSYLKGSTE